MEGIHRTFFQFLSAILILIPYVMMTSGVTLGKMNTIGCGNCFSDHIRRKNDFMAGSRRYSDIRIYPLE